MGYTTRIVQHDADVHARQVLAYHWRPEDYAESDDYLFGDDPPRWQATHICRYGVQCFGVYDWDASPKFSDGDSVGGCAAAAQRSMGPVQLKVGFQDQITQPDGLPWSMTLDVDCARPDDETETRRVRLVQGARGPEDPTDPHDWGDLVRLTRVDRFAWDAGPFPFAGSGLYADVTDVRTVAHSTLAESIGTTETEIPVEEGTLFERDGGIVRIDEEFVRYAEVEGDRLVGCVRGYDDPQLGQSDPASHQQGAAVDGQYPDCRAIFWSDGPALDDTSGVQVRNGEYSLFAALLSGGWGRPHYLDDAVGRLHRLFVNGGDVWQQVRAHPLGRWDRPRRLTDDQESDYPSGDKDARGALWLVRQRGRSEVVCAWSADDRATMPEGNEVTIATDLRFPCAVEYGGIIYLVGYRDGGQYVRRYANYGRTALPFAGGALESLIATESDPERVGFLKMESSGRRLLVGVPQEPEIVTYVSEDDGGSWAEV